MNQKTDKEPLNFNSIQKAAEIMDSQPISSDVKYFYNLETGVIEEIKKKPCWTVTK